MAKVRDEECDDCGLPLVECVCSDDDDFEDDVESDEEEADDDY